MPEHFIKRPTELLDWFSYILIHAPDEYPAEDEVTNASAFAEAFEALVYFRAHTPSEEGREAVAQCDRNLHVAYELYEKGDDISASRFIQETEEMFQRARKYIDVSDE